jgi:hypothetical protein
MGGAIGVAIYTTILSNAYTPRLIRNIKQVVAATGFPQSETASLIEAAVKNTAAAYKTVPHITGEVIKLSEVAVKKGYVYATGVVWLTAVGFGGLAVICACFIRSPPQSQKTGVRAVKLQNELSSVQDTGA